VNLRGLEQKDAENAEGPRKGKNRGSVRRCDGATPENAEMLKPET